MLGWLTQLGFLQILIIFSDLKEKKYFYRKYLGQSQTTPSIIHYSELCDSRWWRGNVNKDNKYKQVGERSIYQLLAPSEDQSSNQSMFA